MERVAVSLNTPTPKAYGRGEVIHIWKRDQTIGVTRQTARGMPAGLRRPVSFSRIWVRSVELPTDTTSDMESPWGREELGEGEGNFYKSFLPLPPDPHPYPSKLFSRGYGMAEELEQITFETLAVYLL